MKKITFLLSLLISAVSFGQATDIFFSKYGEGSGQNKFLEIYNGTGVDVDLGEYSIELYANDNTDPNDPPQTFSTGTILPNGEVIVLYHASATAPEIIAEGDMESSAANFNGNDAVVLLHNGDIIDIIGEIASDTYWTVGDTPEGAKDHTLVRKSDVCSPNSTPLGSFGTDAETSEWIVLENEQYDGIGSHTGCDDMAVGDVLLSEFVMYPNPSRDGKVTIQTVEGSEISVTVFDILGKKVISKSLSNNELNISGLKTGIYLVQVSQNGATVTKKLIVE
ncbi:MAG TPA: T9SS type A sorting domain-containing protein [Salinimicrobium sp.]|nr:T9SS type A sorting domain-containing protein [Salinimicrobium sp.]